MPEVKLRDIKFNIIVAMLNDDPKLHERLRIYFEG